MTTMIALVGEQPMPLLLPARYLQPTATVLLCTSRTKAVAARLASLLPNARLEECDPYDVAKILEKLHTIVAGQSEILFNLTGGTKMMMLAAFAVAAQGNHDFVYLESEKQQSVLYRYQLVGGVPVFAQKDVLPTVISLDDYLKAHLTSYTVEGFSCDEQGNLNYGGRFERAVHSVLHQSCNEVLAGVRPAGVDRQIEIDLAIRCGNQVAIAEVKVGGAEDRPKQGIDQLSTAGGREYLGTYTTKFLITGRTMPPAIQTLAREKNIQLLELARYRGAENLSAQHAEKLSQSVLRHLNR